MVRRIYKVSEKELNSMKLRAILCNIRRGPYVNCILIALWRGKNRVVQFQRLKYYQVRHNSFVTIGKGGTSGGYSHKL